MLYCVQLLSRVRLFATLWTVARQAPLSMGILQARILEWVAMLSSRGSSQPRDRTQVSHIGGTFFTIRASRKALSHHRNPILIMPVHFSKPSRTWCYQIFLWLNTELKHNIFLKHFSLAHTCTYAQPCKILKWQCILSFPPQHTKITFWSTFADIKKIICLFHSPHTHVRIWFSKIGGTENWITLKNFFLVRRDG